jgi:signal transduction histidine kinase
VDAAGAGGEVILEASPLGEGIQLLIRDTGPGIPHDLVDRIWEPDFTTKSRGTGLGLPLVRQTVRLHGGEVDATTWEGGGAEIRVYLPSKMPEKVGLDEDTGTADDLPSIPDITTHTGPSEEEPGDGHPDR